MTGTGLDRRQVVRLLAAFGAALAAGGAPGSAAAAPCLPWLGEDEVEGAKELGRAYLQQHPGSDAGDVWALLQPAASDAGDLSGLAELVRKDYEEGSVLNLAGWYISETEGRVFAAIATRC